MRQISSELGRIFEEPGYTLHIAEEAGPIYSAHDSYGCLYCGCFTRVDLKKFGWR